MPPKPKSQIHTFEGRGDERVLLEISSPIDGALPCSLVEIDDQLILLVPYDQVDKVTIILCELHTPRGVATVKNPQLYGAIHDPTTDTYHSSLPLPSSSVLRRI